MILADATLFDGEGVNAAPAGPVAAASAPAPALSEAGPSASASFSIPADDLSDPSSSSSATTAAAATAAAVSDPIPVPAAQPPLPAASLANGGLGIMPQNLLQLPIQPHTDTSPPWLNGFHSEAATADALEALASTDLSSLTAGDTSSSSILSPTSTVCRGSYHQCGTARRVKVYELQNDSWFDRGTGYCAGVYDEARDEALLVARKEEACTLLARNGLATGSNDGEAADGIPPGDLSILPTAASSDTNAVPAAPNLASVELPSSSEAANEPSSSAPSEAAAAPAANPPPSAEISATGSTDQVASTSTAAGSSTSNAPGTALGIPTVDTTPMSGSKPLESEYVIVVSEDLNTDDVILKSRVLRDDVYQRQAETLVVWTEADGTDMALSFQEAEGCHELWEFLTEVQKHFILVDSRGGADGYALDPDGDDSPTGTPNPNSPAHTLGFGPGSMDDISLAIENFTLPDPSLATLHQIELRVKDAASKGQSVRDRVAEWLLRENYIKKLLPVFNDAEELEVLDSLHLLCTIIQSILMLNDNAIFEHILQDDVFLGVVGMLEYDPEYPKSKASYREYLSDPSRYRKVVEIKDETIVRKIHQTYRLLYLKDVILARVLDDPTFSILNSFVFYNQVDIINYCISNEEFLNELFGIFEAEQNQPEARKFEAVFFLQQLCAMGKQIQLPNRIALYRTLTEWGLLSVVEYALGQDDQKLRNAAAEVLMTIIEYDANSVRWHILEQAEQQTKPLMTVLVDLLHTEKDLGLKTQMAEAVRVLLETNPDGPSAQLAAAAHTAAGLTGRAPTASDPDKFLSWLYEGEIEHLFSPLRELPEYRFLNGDRLIDLENRTRSALCGHLCDLFCFTMLHHSFRSQFYLISSGISRRIATLLFAKEKHIRLGCLRFFKICLGSHNQYTNRHLTGMGLMDAILSVAASEADRDNLVSSACLEFFDLIRRENMKMLIAHLMENYADKLKALSEHRLVGKTFAGLALQYHKNNEVHTMEPDNTAQKAEEARRKRDLERRAGNRSTMDAAEEDYFNDADEDEKPAVTKTIATKRSLRNLGARKSAAAAASSSNATKLVDYGDDDAEDDVSLTSSNGTAVSSDDADAKSNASSSTTLSADAATNGGGFIPEGSAEEQNKPEVKSSSRLKRRRSQTSDGHGVGADGEADEDMLDRLAKKTATAGKRRSAAAAGDVDMVAAMNAKGSTEEAASVTGNEADATEDREGKEDEEDEELEGGFIRVDMPTSPSAAKTTNAGRAGKSGRSSAGSDKTSSKKISINLKSFTGKGRGSGASSTGAGNKSK
ncbi:Platinum sensitivity protein [Tilletia horrida]|uniref:Platinum sensitivity protein n=1 Tax=Tilletia horrida TaxID=155126 RepID=A0AAN6GRK2_9BASI|nr:Platinum sensitivity protein [Tilletia horrida]KAK0562842.1 Platinum sensitivity protein [Tilletia horrida]